MQPEPQPQLELPLLDSPEARGKKQQGKHHGYLLHPAKVRQYALELAQRERHHAFAAVTVEFIQRIDARLRNIIQDEIKRHPSKGKRIT